MIDIEKAKLEFIKYVKEYDIDSGRIKLKLKHILKVTENSKYIAQNLKLSDEQVALAELIGLFHDIGRFEQVRKYDTFSDKDTGVDHAAYSLKVLYEDGLITRFIDTNKYDEIIKKAVFNHNKIQIDASLKDDELLFSKIIRDADKLDIYRVINEEEMDDIFWYKEFKNLKATPIVIDEFLSDRLVKYKDVKNNADLIFVFYSYIYDFNFPICLKLIKENLYLDKFFLRIKETFIDKEIIDNTSKVLNICNEYIEKQIKNNSVLR